MCQLKGGISYGVAYSSLKFVKVALVTKPYKWECTLALGHEYLFIIVR